MVKAKVSLQSVTNLQQKADAEIEPVESLRKSTDCISEITQCIAEEVDKILAIFPECQDALEIGQDKLQKLQEELKVLEAKLACTPPTITVSEPDGVDSEGNTKYTTSTVPNPTYIALEQEIDNLESRISRLQDLISVLEEQIQTLDETRKRFETSRTTFLFSQETINSTCTSLIRKSKHASEQLKRAEEAIQNYLDEQVQLNDVPSHTSIVWGHAYPKYTKTTVVMEDFRSKGQTLRRNVYIRDDIDLDMKSPLGKENRKRMRSGQPPYVVIGYKKDKNTKEFKPVKKRVELHHLTQREIITNPESKMTHGTLVEISANVHHENHNLLHIPYPKEKGIRRSYSVVKTCDKNGVRKHKRSDGARSYTSFRSRYWKERLKKYEEAEKLL